MYAWRIGTQGSIMGSLPAGQGRLECTCIYTVKTLMPQ